MWVFFFVFWTFDRPSNLKIYVLIWIIWNFFQFSGPPFIISLKWMLSSKDLLEPRLNLNFSIPFILSFYVSFCFLRHFFNIVFYLILIWSIVFLIPRSLFFFSCFSMLLFTASYSNTMDAVIFISLRILNFRGFFLFFSIPFFAFTSFFCSFIMVSIKWKRLLLNISWWSLDIRSCLRVRLTKDNWMFSILREVKGKEYEGVVKGWASSEGE